MVPIKHWSFYQKGTVYYITTHKMLLDGIHSREPIIRLIVEDANDVISKYNSLVAFCENLKMTADENESFLFITGKYKER